MRLTVLTLGSAMLALSACVVVEPPVVVEPDPDACRASTYQGLVGQPARVLASMALPTPTRVIRPGQAVTMDYNAFRLNVEIDRRERISRVYCG